MQYQYAIVGRPPQYAIVLGEICALMRTARAPASVQAGSDQDMQLQRQNVEGRDPVDEARFVKAKASKLVCECSARRHNTQSAKYAIAICNSRAWRYEDIAFTIVVRSLRPRAP